MTLVTLSLPLGLLSWLPSSATRVKATDPAPSSQLIQLPCPALSNGPGDSEERTVLSAPKVIKAGNVPWLGVETATCQEPTNSVEECAMMILLFRKSVRILKKRLHNGKQSDFDQKLDCFPLFTT